MALLTELRSDGRHELVVLGEFVGRQGAKPAQGPLVTTPTKTASNQGFALLGRVIEHCTTQPWRDHVRETILNPLRMSATLLFDPPAFPDGYVEEAGAIVPEDRYAPGYEAAAAGWTTTADLLALGRALIDPELGLIVCAVRIPA